MRRNLPRFWACPSLHLLCSLSLAAATATAGHASAAELVEFDFQGRHFEGLALGATDHQLTLLSRDGRVVEFSGIVPQNLRRQQGAFHAYGVSQMRGMLAREFGNAFEVTATSHFLVVHPRGTRAIWANRFEDLYRTYHHYFSVRRIQLKAPAFPLVAIVFPERKQYLDYARRVGDKLTQLTVGYYSPRSNRVAVYDLTATHGHDLWKENAATVIHEATHQSAFNTGLHNRFGSNPRWVVEGLGTMFEARGVWNSRAYPHRADRINRYQFERFAQYLARRPPGSLQFYLSHDRMFEHDMDGAYAQAWALTFYLAETQPQRYIQYLERIAARPANAPVDRVREFTAVFGDNLPVLEQQFLNFITSLGRESPQLATRQ